MARPGYTRRRVMIWGKTYPELSSRHTETVCTGAVELATGKPLRLYPVPLRYLRGDQQYHLYDVFDIDMVKSTRDPRPESHQVDTESLVKVDRVDSDADEWAERRQRIFADASWHFESVGDLKSAQEAGTHSMGVVRPGTIVDVAIEKKAQKEGAEHERKWDEVTSQHDLFPKEYRELEFIPVTIRLRWHCASTACCTCRNNPHDISVIDWGLIELGRKTRNWEKAASKLRTISDLDTHDFRLFMGNLFTRQQTFVVIGLWYPKRREQVVLL